MEIHIFVKIYKVMKILFSVLFILILNVSFSQEISFCGFDDINNDRDFVTIYTPLDRDSVEWVPRSIPVIVHVLHTGEPYGTFPNISEEVVIQQIQRLNNVLAGEESATMSNSNISFCIANLGNPSHPEYGIRHHNITQAPPIYLNSHVWVTNIFDHISNNYAINPDIYCNIYVYQYQIGPEGAAWFPPSNNGIIIRTNHFIGNNPSNNISIFAHEVGHYLGLQHTWKNGTTATYQTCEEALTETDCMFDGDYVCDTPPTKNHNCTIHCVENDPGYILRRNFMGHTAECSSDFTDKQIDLMHSIIHHYKMDQINNECSCHLETECDWDLDNNEVVSLQDILIFLSVFNTAQNCKNGDFNNDTFVNTSDLLVILSKFSFNCITG
jgi:hypothetical protein